MATNKFDKSKAIKVALETLTQTTPKIYPTRPEMVSTCNLNQNGVSCLVEYTNSIPDDGVMSGAGVIFNTYSNGTVDVPIRDDGITAFKITPGTTSAVGVSISQNLRESD